MFDIKLGRIAAGLSRALVCLSALLVAGLFWTSAHAEQVTERCSFLFARDFSALDRYPAIFDFENGFVKINRLMNNVHERRKGRRWKLFKVFDNTDIETESQINLEFQIVTIGDTPKLLYMNTTAGLKYGRSFDEADVLIVRSQEDLPEEWSAFLARETDMYVSSVPGCRITRHIRNNRVLRTLVEVTPEQARYQGRSCVRAGILMGLGLNNLAVLTGSEYVGFTEENKYLFLFTKATGLDHIYVPEIKPGMSLDEFEKVGRSLSCDK